MEQKVYQLSEICEIKSGKRIPKDMRFVEVPTNHPYIRARDIKDGKISVDSLIYLEDKVYEKIKKYIICSDDIAITIVGASVGDIAYAQTSVNGYNLTENAVRLTNFNNKVHSKYLFYMLFQKQYKDFMQLIAGAAAQPKLGIYKIQKIKVKLPDFPEQKRIASVLSAYDDLIEKNNRKIQILQDMAEELYKEWFVRFRFPGHETAKFTDEIPDGWEVKKASEIFNITIGRTPSRAIFSYFTDEREGNYSWISISDMRNKMFVSDTKEYLTKEAINSCNMPMVAPNTVLLSFKLTVGQVAITTEETSTNEAIAHFNTQDENLREYTYLYLQNFNYNELGNTSAIGNAINSTIVKNMKFVLPDEDLLVKFKGIAGNIVDTILLLTKQNNNLMQQRDLLLPRLMSGKLEVKVKQEV